MSARVVVLAAAAAWLARSELARRSAYREQEQAAAARRRLGRNAWVPVALDALTAEARPGEAVTSLTAQVQWKDDQDPILLIAHPHGPVERMVAMPPDPGGDGLRYRQITVPEPREWQR